MAKVLAILVLVLAFVYCSTLSASAQTTEFTYQGRLLDNSLPPTANYDFEFSLWKLLVGGTQEGSTQTVTGVAVVNGVFTVSLNFGNQFFGDPRFLQIAVRPAGGGAYTTLAPRQPFTSAPYSIRGANAGSADALSASCILCVTDAHISDISGSKVSGPVANAVNATTAGNVTGVVAIANGGTGSTTKNFVDLTTNQTAAGDKTFTGAVGVTGASGVFNGNGSGLTNLNGANIANNTINASALASDTFPNQRNLSLLGQRRWDLLGQRVTVGNEPIQIAFDGANIWVTNQASNNVTKLRASDGAVQGTFPIGNAPQGVAFDGSGIWVVKAGDGTVTRLRASDGLVQGTFTVGTTPIGVAFDGANIWVANQDSNSVTKLRASDGAVQGTFPVGVNPQQVAFDGANIWVTNFTSGTVTKLRAADGVLQGTFTVSVFSVGASGVAFDGANIWVANFSSNNVVKLPVFP